MLSLQVDEPKEIFINTLNNFKNVLFFNIIILCIILFFFNISVILFIPVQ